MGKSLEEQKDDFLRHYGVKGMRWGKRGQAPGYSDQQARRDTQVYGKRGAKRINNALNKGDQISTARGDEKTRRDRVMGRNKYVRQGGKLAGGAVGGGLGLLGVKGLAAASTSAVGREAISRVIGKNATTMVAGLANSPSTQAAVTLGASSIGYMLSGDIAVGINMRTHGYDPNRR